MEENKTKRKPKRILKDISFENESAHLALVHRDQGGPASGADYRLVVKSTAQYSDEFLEKAAAIKVEYDLNEYLLKFYESDQEDIAKALGKETIEDALVSIQVMKRLYEAENITDVLAGLSEDEYLSLLQDQAKVEKAFKNIEKGYKKKVRTKEKELEDKESVEKEEADKEYKESTEVAKATEDDTSTINVDVEKGEGVDSPVVKQKKKESKPMTETVHVAEKEVELVEKSQFDSIQKSLNDTQIELQKALDLVNELKKEKQEAIAKARKEQLVEVAGDKAEVLFKACGEADEQVFAEVIKALGEMKAQVEKSKMFEEVGASVEEDTVKEDPLTRMIKSKYNKQ